MRNERSKSKLGKELFALIIYVLAIEKQFRHVFIAFISIKGVATCLTTIMFEIKNSFVQKYTHVQ